MPRVRPLRADVRAEVLAAAWHEFAEHGYHRTGLDRIAARAGFSKGAVYSNFASKQELFLELLRSEVERMADEVVGTGSGSGPRPEASGRGVRVLAARLLDLASDGAGQLVFAEFRAAAGRDPELAIRLAEVRDQIVAAVASRLRTEVAQRGATLAVDSREAATLVLAVVNGLALEQVGHVTSQVSVETLSAVLESLLVRSASPAPSTAPSTDRKVHVTSSSL